jgi:hypothetical protein
MHDGFVKECPHMCRKDRCAGTSTDRFAHIQYVPTYVFDVQESAFSVNLNAYTRKVMKVRILIEIALARAIIVRTPSTCVCAY